MIIFYIINANFILPERVAEGGLDEDYWDDVSLILDIIVLLFVFRYAFRELSQMWAFGFVEYFLSLWNYIDIILILMLSGVIAFDIMSCIHYYVNVELLKVWHAYTIFISFVRFISFSRGIQGTSFMIRLDLFY